MTRRVVTRIKRALFPLVRAGLVRYARARPAPDAGERVIILLGSAWGMGGTIRAALNLAGYLAREHDVEILSVVRRRERPFFAFPPGVKVTAVDDLRPDAPPPPVVLGPIRTFLRRRQSALMYRHDRLFSECSLWTDVRLVRALRRQSGTLIGTRAGLNMIAAELAPPGLIAIGQEQMNLRAHAPHVRRRMARVYPKLDALVVLTEGDMRRYDKLLSGRVRLARIPNTVRPLGGAGARLTERTVLAAGRLTPQKGFDLLIRAYSRVAAEHPDWRLRICGDGPQRARLQRLIDERGLTGVVTLAGPAEHLGEEMERASVFVLSSRFEGFPLVLVEAMSKGMAIVAFDCPTGPRDVIDDHRNGLLVRQKRIGALAEGMLELIEDEGLRRRCGAAAAETARAYAIDVIGPHWDRLFSDLHAERQQAQRHVGRPPLPTGRVAQP
jgi:glycosyltransferase involved in cell wall biosynthesis